MIRIGVSRYLLAIVASLAASTGAAGVQHLVSPGDDWQRLGPALRPGDEIILMPGRHEPAALENLQGTPKKPITIRGFDPKNPSVILARQEGILLKRPQHVVVQQLAITGATINGIRIDDTVKGEASTDEEPSLWTADVTIRNVRITKTGPRGDRDAIKIAGVRDVRIMDCHIEGWAGSAIDLVSCQDVTIEDCAFIGQEHFEPANVMEMRAGSQRIYVRGSTFRADLTSGIVIGSLSEVDEFKPPLTEATKPGTIFNASAINVEHCIFINSQVPITFNNSNRCTVKNNTFVRPRECVFAIVNEQIDPRFGRTRRGLIGGNVIVWEPGDLAKLFYVGDNCLHKTFVVEHNLWWSPDLDKTRVTLGKLPGAQPAEQTFEIDPQLDEHYRPTASSLTRIGAVLD